MNPARDGQGRPDVLRLNENDAKPASASGTRSWEPPCWPSDGWETPNPGRRRAIGWRGSRAH